MKLKYSGLDQVRLDVTKLDYKRFHQFIARKTRLKG